MSRTIISKRDIAMCSSSAKPGDFKAGGPAIASAGKSQTESPRQADAYVDKLLKLIPSEVVALWVTLRSTLTAADTAPGWLQWVAFLALLCLTPIYMKRIAGVSKTSQVCITTGGFVVWVFSLGGVPFATLPSPYFLPIYGALLLPLYTFAMPLWDVN
jgi:hypothetical protein